MSFDTVNFAENDRITVAREFLKKREDDKVDFKGGTVRFDPNETENGAPRARRMKRTVLSIWENDC
jgi:hypothetical protein